MRERFWPMTQRPARERAGSPCRRVPLLAYLLSKTPRIVVSATQAEAPVGAVAMQSMANSETPGKVEYGITPLVSGWVLVPP
jgi:hypothetical protein